MLIAHHGPGKAKQMLHAAGSSLVARFQHAAVEHAHAAAVVCNADTITYSDLHHRTLTIAAALVEEGVRADIPVGLITARTVDMIAGMLGILAAGGAFVPLDPTLPRARLNQMIEQAGLTLILNAAASSGWRTDQARVLPIIEIGPVARPPTLPPIQPQQLAYILFTSGSTGKPKGVMIEHRNVLALLDGIEQIAPHREPLIGTVAAPFSFDVSVWEVFSVLTHGGTLHIIDTPETLPRAVVEHGITSAYVPPALLDDVAAALHASKTGAALDRLLVGVEPIPQKRLQRFRRVLPGLRILNAYGPTETTICATVYPFRRMKTPHYPTPIGKPLPGYSVTLVDEHMHPVQTGATGEIVIGGAGVARGYVCDKALTAGRFVPDPFSDQPDARLYRTGDFARLLPDGNLDFVGRLDRQVKIRGFRVELAEVETPLHEYPGVKGVAVTAHADPVGTQSLVAYLVWDTPRHTAEVDRLRAFLADRLPVTMIPSLFINIDSIPVTAHGKTDFDALPAPDWSQRQVAAPPTAPRDLFERQMIALWSDVLGVREIGVYDNFFELGGHSLSAARLLAAIEKTFSQTIPLASFFRAPTVAELTARIQRGVNGSTPAPPIHPAPDGARIPLSHEQERLWFLAQLEPGNPAYNQSFALRLTGRLNIDSLHASLSEIVRRHDSLRTTFAALDGQPYQIVSPDLALELPVLDLIPFPGATQFGVLHDQLLQEAQRPFYLNRGPLIRTTLLKLTTDQHILLIVTPRIVMDGWSTGVLARELSALYAAYENGEKPQLDHLPIQIADYAYWRRQEAQQAALHDQLPFWQQQLGRRPPRLRLPADHPRPATRSYQGEVQFLALPGPLLDALRLLSQRANATLFMTLLAAFQTLLYRYTGQEDVLVGSFVSNRTRPELEHLIGPFLNNVVFRARVSGDQPFADLLHSVRETACEVYEHGAVPVEWVIEQMALPRDRDSWSLFDIAFHIVQAGAVEFFDFDSGVTIFDLEVELWEREQDILCMFRYNRDLFDHDTITRLMTHYWTLLESIAADPQCAVADLPLLSEVELHRLLFEWNDTTTDLPDTSLADQVDAQAARTPHAAAVIDGAERVTYAELVRQANRIAYVLRDHGVEAESVVGVWLPVSARQIAAILGVIKAGGAVLPLDPAQPISTDHMPPFLLADDAPPPSYTGRVIRDWDAPDTFPNAISAPEHLAWITSGGVMFEHRALANGVAAVQALAGLRPDDRMASDGEIDGSLLFACLTHGAALALHAADIPALPQHYTPAETAGAALGGDPLRPAANMRAIVLDAHQQPVPVGLVGDLLLGGDGLARGYWQRPALTAERFVPDPFTPGERLFKTGERARWRIDGSLELCSDTGPEPSPTGATLIPPRNAVEDRLAGLWSNLLGVPRVGVRENFFEMGGHSLLAVRLMAQIEKDFGRSVPLATLFAGPTVEQLAAILAEEAWTAPWSSLVPIRPAGSRPPFFFIHSLDGDVVMYYNLLPYMDADQPLYGLRAQGLGGSVPPDQRIEDMAARYIREIRTLQPEGPYTLGGYSLGGLIAFEMARQLHQQGDSVALLAVLDTVIVPDLATLEVLPFVNRNMNRLQRGLIIARKLVALPVHEKSPYLRRMIRTFVTGQNAEPLSPPAVQAIEAAGRAAMSQYKLEPYAGRVTLFFSRERETSYIVNTRPTWERIALGGLDVIDVPGSHRGMMAEPHVRELAARLTASLQKAQPR